MFKFHGSPKLRKSQTSYILTLPKSAVTDKAGTKMHVLTHVETGTIVLTSTIHSFMAAVEQKQINLFTEKPNEDN